VNRTELEIDINDGLSSYDIAKKYGKGQSTISYWLKKFNLSTNPKSKYEEMNWKLWQTQYDSGLSWNEIKGFSNDAVDWARKNGKIKTRTVSEAHKMAWKMGKIDPSVYRTPEHRKIMSRFGGLKPNAGRCKHIKYTSIDGHVVDLQGSWELKLVEFLDKLKITWKRNKVGYKYEFKGKEHLYFPDFYLPTKQIYIEVKGYETDKDRAKWNQFPFELIVVKKQEIQDLTAWWNKAKIL